MPRKLKQIEQQLKIIEQTIPRVEMFDLYFGFLDQKLVCFDRLDQVLYVSTSRPTFLDL